MTRSRSAAERSQCVDMECGQIECGHMDQCSVDTTVPKGVLWPRAPQAIGRRRGCITHPVTRPRSVSTAHCHWSSFTPSPPSTVNLPRPPSTPFIGDHPPSDEALLSECHLAAPCRPPPPLPPLPSSTSGATRPLHLSATCRQPPPLHSSRDESYSQQGRLAAGCKVAGVWGAGLV